MICNCSLAGTAACMNCQNRSVMSLNNERVEKVQHIDMFLTLEGGAKRLLRYVPTLKDVDTNKITVEQVYDTIQTNTVAAISSKEFKLTFRFEDSELQIYELEDEYERTDQSDV